MNEKRLRLVAIAFLLVLLGALIYTLTLSGKKPAPPSVNNGLRYDSNSGDTISNPPGRTPEKYGTSQNNVVFLGLTNLLNIGVSSYQVSDFRAAVTKYSASKNNFIKQASVASKIQSTRLDTGATESKFRLVLNDTKNMSATFTYWSITNSHLVITDEASGVVAFDSGPM